MILHPRSPAHDELGGAMRTAWEVVEETQRRAAHDWWLIAQPDHAALAADLAARLQSPLLPTLDTKIIQAIALHDEGWRTFDAFPIVKNGRPVSFLEMPVPDFLQAWRESIVCASHVAPIGGVLVSEHFCRLARVGLSREITDVEAALLRDFLNQEGTRQEKLRKAQTRSGEDISVLVDVLQFCDLLSLYLCCGSRHNVEFPQVFCGRRMQLKREGELCRTEPPLFGNGASLAVPARGSPGDLQSITLPMLVK